MKYYIPILLSLLVFTIPFSPITSIFICLLFSLSLPEAKNKYLILLITAILSFDFAVIYSAKNFHGGATDFEIYYQFYESILYSKTTNFLDALLNNSSHFEPLYYLINTIIIYFFGKLTEVQYSILLNFICIYSVFLSLIKYSSSFTVKNILLLIVITVFISKIGSITLFWRQSLAASFIILFLYFNGTKRYIFLALATGFHFSSIIVAPLCYLILNKKKNNYTYILLILIAFIWPILGKSILQSILSLLGSTKSHFFTNDMDYPYFLDTLKTIVFSIPIIIFYKLQTLKIKPESIYYTLILEILILIAFGTIPHFFRIIYPIAIVIIYLHTTLVLLKLNEYYFIFSLLFLIFVNFFRLTSDELSFQFPLYSLTPFYYFDI